MREAGIPGPWTDDPVLREFRFCNIFREDDRTTRWFRRNIRGVLQRRPEVILATIAFRWFNRIETGEALMDVLLGPETWNEGAVRAALEPRRAQRLPIVTGAYVIKTPDGMSKLDGICACMARAKAQIDHDRDMWLEPGSLNLEQAHVELMNIPYLGSFMAYEIVTDLRHTRILGHADDICSWAAAGPGAARGLRWVTGELHPYTSERGQAKLLDGMRGLLLASTFDHNWPRRWPRWEMREVEHTLCEFDKYCRARGGERLKRRYQCPTNL